jgi:hypothetical protein
VNSTGFDSLTLRSPVSFVSAKLSNALRQARKSQLQATIVNLYFFCRENSDWDDDLDNGSEGLMNSLLAQLLRQYKTFYLSEIEDLSNLDTQNIKQLLRIFKELIEQLPEEVIVFCTLDSLSMYESAEFEKVTETLTAKLIAMVRRRAKLGGCTFKLLLTAPGVLQLDAASVLDDETEVVNCPEKLESGDGFADTV